MTCRELADFIADYLADALSRETRVEFERHLAECGNCARFLAGYQVAMELGRRAFEDLDAPVPPAVPEELVQAILKARR